MSNNTSDTFRVEDSLSRCLVCGAALSTNELSSAVLGTAAFYRISWLVRFIHMQRYHPDYLSLQFKFGILGASLLTVTMTVAYVLVRWESPILFALPFLVLTGASLISFRTYRNQVRHIKAKWPMQHQKIIVPTTDLGHVPTYRWELNRCHICSESIAISGEFKHDMENHIRLTHPEYYKSTRRLMRPAMATVWAFLGLLIISVVVHSQLLILLGAIGFIPVIMTFLMVGLRNERRFVGRKSRETPVD